MSSSKVRIDKIDYSQAQPWSGGGRPEPQRGRLPAVTAAGGCTLWAAGFFFRRITALSGHLNQDLHKSTVPVNQPGTTLVLVDLASQSVYLWLHRDLNP